MNLTGTFAIIALVLYILSNRTALHLIFLKPYGWICIAFLRFFGTADVSDDYALKTDYLNALCFLLFSAAFLLSSKRPAVTIARLVFAAPARPAKGGDASIPLQVGIRSRVLRLLTAIVLIWAASDLLVNSYAFGSFNSALLRFYSGSTVNQVDPAVYRWLNIVFLLSVVSLFLIRLDGQCNPSVGKTILFWILFVVYEIVTLPRGTVGFVLTPFLIILFIECLRVLRMRAKRVSIAVFFLSGLFGLLTGAALLQLRGTSFESFYGLRESLLGLNELDMGESLNSSHSIVFEYAVKSVQKYRSVDTQLNYYSLYGIAVNLVPRGIWPEKPVGYGKVLAIEQGASPEGGVSFAAGIAGEGYANGGLAGVVVFSLLFGAISGFLSSLSWELLNAPRSLQIAVGFQCWVAAQLFVRGDMLAAWAAAIYPLLLMAVVMRIIGNIDHRAGSWQRSG